MYSPIRWPSRAVGEERLLFAKDVAQILRCSIRTVWYLRANGRLPAVKIPGTCATRFRLTDVELLMRGDRAGSPAPTRQAVAAAQTAGLLEPVNPGAGDAAGSATEGGHPQ